ncbi:MAG: hypothetical protein QOH03_3818 [Kribbellaceae bacterium]|jgi:hypothetical protein|nr:hypothetical protein [Kribbellaceae bacterium]
MGSIARLVAVVSLAGAATFGGAAAAQAAPLQSNPAVAAPASVQTVHEFFCGSNYDYCVKQRNTFQHYGLAVSEVWYRSGQTCPGGGGCGDGWLFNWSE